MTRRPALVSGGLRSHALVILGYLGLYYLFTFPALHTFASMFLCDAGDGLQNVWNMWWIKTAVESGQNPWVTDHLFYPDGITLIGATLNPFNGFAGIPIDWLFGPIVAHNTMIVFSYVACGWFTQLLLQEIGAPFWPAAFGGAIFTYSSYHLAHGVGHMQLVALEWVPFFLWAWIRVLDKPSHRRALLAAGALLLVMLCDYYYTLYSVMAGFGLLVFRAAALRAPLFFLHRDRWRSTLTFVGASFALCGPMAYQLLRANQLDRLHGVHDEHTYVNDLLGAAVPGPNWRFSHLSEWFWRNSPFAEFKSEASVEIKFTVLALGIYALVIARRAGVLRHIRTWLVLGTCFWLLSLGPVLRINGQDFKSIPMPHDALKVIFPPLEMGGLPIRFAALYHLAAAVLATFGITWLFRERGRRRWLALPLVAVWGVESMTMGQPVTLPPERTTFSELSNLPDGAVMGTEFGPLALWYQTIHQKPVGYGYVARYPAATYERGMQRLNLARQGQYEELMRSTGARYLVRHLSDKAPDRDEFRVIAAEERYELYVLADDPLADNPLYEGSYTKVTPAGSVRLHLVAPEHAGLNFFCAFSQTPGPGPQFGNQQLQITADQVFDIAMVRGNGTFQGNYGVIDDRGRAVINIDARTLKANEVDSLWFSVVFGITEDDTNSVEITQPKQIVLPK